MMPEKNKQPKVSLEDLFTLKRAERPPAEFWDTFQRDFHSRQRAAAIEPKRWWFVLPRIFAGMARFQMPMGAAAVLAVTFLSFREYSEPGFEVAYTATPTVAAVLMTPQDESLDEPQAEVVVNEQTEALIASLAEEPDSTQATNLLAISPMVVWAGVSAVAAVAASESPSARSIAANLAAVQANGGSIRGLMGVSELNLSTPKPSSDPLTEVTLPTDSRDRLFAYQPNAAKDGSSIDNGQGVDIHSRLASQLSDDLLYDSVRRVTAGGDRLTLKF
jgi:hypothetical protein